MSFVAALLALALTGNTAHLGPQTAGTTDTTQPPPPDTRRTQVNDALARQDYATAQKLLLALTTAEPKDAELQYDLGYADESLDQDPAAAIAYHRAIALAPTYFAPHLALGLLLARAGDRTAARAEVATAITLEAPDANLKARAYRTLARLDQKTRPDDASAELLQAIKLSPETSADSLLAGELAEQAGDLSAAEKAYTRTLAAEPSNAEAVAALARVRQTQNKPADSQALLTGALAKAPDDPLLQAQLITAYIRGGEPEKALPLAEALHGSHPENAAMTRLLARLYAHDGTYDKAEPLFASLIAAAPAPADPTLLDDDGDALIHQRRYAEAETILKQAVAKPDAFPTRDDLAGAASHLAFAASNNGDPQETLQALALRATVQPLSAASLFLQAISYDKLHQTRQAIDSYRQFLTAAQGKFPNEEFEARHRLIALQHK